MGKAEREVVESAEIIVCKLLSGERMSRKDGKHPFFDLCEELAKSIKRDIPDLIRAEHIGNEYGTLGDIRVIRRKKTGDRFLELKFLDPKSGVGTLANISPDAFVKADIFNAISYSEFLREEGHYEWVEGYLDAFGFYKKLKKRVGTKSIIYEKAGYLKEFLGISKSHHVEVDLKNISPGKSALSDSKRRAVEIIRDIIERDRKERKKYLRILQGSTLNKEKLKKFSLALLTGNHTEEMVYEFMNVDLDLMKDALSTSSYDVWYAYKETLAVVKEDQSRLITLIDSEFGVKFLEDKTSFLIFYKESNADQEKDLLRVAMHWKNKFQGIQTPCLNIFRA